MGASASYQLAVRGASVLGLDQFHPPHEQGSTHGDTRITRLACGEGPQYTPFAERSHEIWKSLEARTGLSLLRQNGILIVAGAGKIAPTHGVPKFLEATVAAARRGGSITRSSMAPRSRDVFRPSPSPAATGPTMTGWAAMSVPRPASERSSSKPGRSAPSCG